MPVANNDLAELKRKPSEVIKYRQWRDKIKMAYCSINDYVCQERLQWEPLPTNTPDEQPMFECKSSTLFANPEDFKILRNDWPYGMTPDITHLVVWLKNRIPLDSTTGDLTYQSRQEINGFVQNIFIRRIGGSDAADRVLWFKNWSSIQSVKGIDHMHVLVRNVSDILLEEWTH